MHFGKTLKARLYKPWAHHYLDYTLLKDILEQDKVQLSLPAGNNEVLSTQSSTLSVRGLGLSTRNTTLTFQAELDYEVRKVVLFFLHQQGELAHRISLLTNTGSSQRVDDTRQDLITICNDLIHLIEFIELNITAARKILKKHDRVLRGKRELTARYLFRPLHDHSYLDPLYEYSGLDSIISIASDLWDREVHHATMPNNDLQAPMDSVLKARNKLQSASDFVEILAAQMLMEDESFKGKSYNVRRISNSLNFLSTFLHLTDYYVVAPGCGSYSTLMGGDESLAGLIIGMNSVAALLSTLIYSYWTTWSYRGPLICATCCQIIGDIIYALAFPLGGSLQLVMLGRFISGFGSARALNRRYIADTFSPQDRTSASATFVTAGALGTSAGPLLAAGLYMLIPDESKTPFWRVENAPCWIMAAIWCVYLVLIIKYFEEPDHLNGKHSNDLNEKETTELQNCVNEKSSLLSNQTELSFRSSSSMDTRPLWQNVAVMLTFLIYFVLKFILESLLSSTAVLTGYYFSWNDGQAGLYLAMLGFLVLPANWVVAKVSTRYDDRELILATEVCMLIGCLTILNYTSSTYETWQYMFASVVIFVGVNMLEGPTMSLLSKSIPRHFRRGFWNVGLLATESGTLGRAVGDVILTLCGSQGVSHILNNAFGTMSLFSGATIAVTLHFYSHLSPSEKDE